MSDNYDQRIETSFEWSILDVKTTRSLYWYSELLKNPPLRSRCSVSATVDETMYQQTRLEMKASDSMIIQDISANVLEAEEIVANAVIFREECIADMSVTNPKSLCNQQHGDLEAQLAKTIVSVIKEFDQKLPSNQEKGSTELASMITARGVKSGVMPLWEMEASVLRRICRVSRSVKIRGAMPLPLLLIRY